MGGREYSVSDCVNDSSEGACVCIQYSCYDWVNTVELTSCLRAKTT